MVYRLAPAPRLPRRPLYNKYDVTVGYHFNGQHETVRKTTAWAPSEDAIRQGFEYSLPLGATVSWSAIRRVD